MRTNIEIDDELMAEAMKATGSTTKRAAVETCLRRIIDLKRQEGIRDLFGKIQWDGDLDEMRLSRILEREESQIPFSPTGDGSTEEIGQKSR